MIAGRIIWTLIAVALAAVAAYLSRFWLFRWWGRDGFLGFDGLVPQGGLVGRWLRGTDFAPFELLIWVLGVFAVLSLVQKLFDRVTRPKNPE